ncbi:unnamed protein product [Caenorhabditis angaria]|uniref:Uncharacterized protein n=1 Tax=Caenorhabditis angaria TaxID=860376 RepID=A0A9P1IRT6_9PELO|nr:unnamed protein product [Caenorhabditis angaria]
MKKEFEEIYVTYNLAYLGTQQLASETVQLPPTTVDKCVKIPGIYSQVVRLSAAEQKTYDEIEFDVAEFRDSVCTKHLPTEVKKTLLLRRWREQSLALHGIEEAFYGSGS